MKIFLLLVLIFLMPFSAMAHPGKTDYRGGHQCWKNCGEWELTRGEYHLHDKEGKPIRLDQKGDIMKTEQPKGVPIPEKRFLLEDPSERASGPLTGVKENSGGKMPDQHVIVEKHHATTFYEESILPLSSILLLLLAFLMLILLILLKKKKEKE
jgi:hypothetical protein